MAIEKLNIDRFLVLSRNHLIIDVRSPGEYNHAHIPGAHSMPLFSDEERKVVGTTYKQESREKAIKVGLDFFGIKMRKMVEEVESLFNSNESTVARAATAKDYRHSQDVKTVFVYCWRGGMRSAGVAWLLDLYGFKVYSLIGGYKKFRNHVLETFKLPFLFRILGGYTGSGKTEVLRRLAENGDNTIDLEAIANHKGSAFGNIGLMKQPGQEMFENLLATALQRIIFSNSPPETDPLQPLPAGLSIWVEDESQRIGLVNIPNDFWNRLRQFPVYFLEIPFEERLDHIVSEYGRLDKQAMIEAIGRIRKRLGGLQAKNAIQLLEEGNTIESFRILLKYYDRFYLKALHNREGLNSLLYTIRCKTVAPENAIYLAQQPKYQPENH